MKKNLIFRAMLCVVLVIAGYIIGHYDLNIPYSHWIAKASYILACLVIGYSAIVDAADNIVHFNIFDQNVIIIAATIGIVIFIGLPEAIFVLFLFEFGKGLQNLCIAVAENSINSSILIKPKKVSIKSEDKTSDTIPELVEVGEIVVVKPGEKFPFDCRITNGNSSISCENITGQSNPINIKENDFVLSGCLNLENSVEACVLKKFSDSFGSQVSGIVENINKNKESSTLEIKVDKISKVYSFIVCTLAVVLAFLPPILLKEAHKIWIERALTFLVIACPGAMIISVPLIIVIAAGTCIRNGIVVKNGKMLGVLRNLNHIAFTKTGILSDGKYIVDKIVPKDISKEELIRIIAHGEKFAKHAVAFPLTQLYKGKYDDEKIRNFEEIPSRGIKANIFLSETLIGNEKLLRENNVPFKNLREPGTIIHVAVSGEYKGYVVLHDNVKEEVAAELEKIRQNGIKELYVLSGDDSSRVVDIAQKVGISECYSELTIKDKVETINNIKVRTDKNHKVGFVGNINQDKEALDTADIGIVLGQYDNLNNEYLSLVNDDVSELTKGIRIAKRVSTIINENVYITIIAKIALLVLGGLAYLNVWQVALGDLIISLIVILHAMRIVK